MPGSDMTLDFAQDRLEFNSFDETHATDFLLVAIQYWQDGMIADSTFREKLLLVADKLKEQSHE